MGKDRRAALAALFYDYTSARYAWRVCNGGAKRERHRDFAEVIFLLHCNKLRNRMLDEQVDKEDADGGEPATCRA